MLETNFEIEYQQNAFWNVHFCLSCCLFEFEKHFLLPSLDRLCRSEGRSAAFNHAMSNDVQADAKGRDAEASNAEGPEERKPILALPAPSDAREDQNDDEATELKVDGLPVRLDKLGPMIIKCVELSRHVTEF